MRSRLKAALLAATLVATPAAVAASPGTPPSAVLYAPAHAGPSVTPDRPGPVTGEHSAPDVGATPADDWRGNSAALYDAILSGRWLAAVAAALLLGVYTVRRIALRRVAWFQTRLGGWLINFGLATTAAVAVGMRAGSLGLATVLDAIALGVCSAGAYQAVRDARRPVAKLDDVG